MGIRGACAGEMVTYTCTVNQGLTLNWIVEPYLSGSTSIRFLSTTAIGTNEDCSDVTAVHCTDLDFVATLTNLANPTAVTGGTIADMTSTLTFTATIRLNGTVVQCRRTTADGSMTMTSSTLNIAGVSVVRRSALCCSATTAAVNR